MYFLFNSIYYFNLDLIYLKCIFYLNCIKIYFLLK